MGALLDALTELVRANLVIPVGDERWPEPRFRMLETIRAFGLSLLFGSGEIDSIRRVHALHTLGRIRALDGTAAHEFIETNAAGIRAALMWSWGAPGDPLFPQLIVALEPYWRRSSDLEEGWLWMERAVDRVQTSVPSDHDRVTILLGASTLARRRADLRRAEQLASEGLRLATYIGSVPDMARALNALGVIATHQSAFGQARGLYQQALSSHRQTNDLPGEAVVLHNIALVTLGEHDLHGAIRLWEEAMPVARRAERKIALIAMLRSMGAVRLAQGRIDCAASFLREALLSSERERDPFNAAVCHALLSMVDVERGNPEPSWAHGTQALKVARSVGEPTAIVLTLTNQADQERRRGDTGAADALLIEAGEIATGMGTPLALQPVLQAMGDLRHQQGAWLDAFEHYGESLRCWLQGGDMLTLVPLLVPFAEVAWRLGEEMMAARMLHVVNVLQTAGLTVPVARRSMHRALCLECGLPPESRNPGLYPDVSFGEQSLQGLVTAIFSDTAPPPLLSDRERTVLGLLVEGHTNAQMAEQLFVSPHTVNTHVRRIYQKMGVKSRSAATRFAMERGLVARPSARP
jgi:DNA-binding CsgD family transcriptional regulator/tetratricopeptide (TPR) repeat protein